MIQKRTDKEDKMKRTEHKSQIVKNCLRSVWKQLLLNWTTLLHVPSHAEKLSKLVVLNCVKLKRHFIRSWILSRSWRAKLHYHVLKGLPYQHARIAHSSYLESQSYICVFVLLPSASKLPVVTYPSAFWFEPNWVELKQQLGLEMESFKDVTRLGSGGAALPRSGLI